MEQFINLFVEHFELCCSALLAVTTTISLIVAIFRKAKFFRLQDFLTYLSTLCSFAESCFGDRPSGSTKLDLVLREARRYSDENHLGLTDDQIVDYIETLLSSPSKTKK